jgi:hypothetical protein
MARGPYLAEVDLAWRCKRLHLDGDDSASLVIKMLNYFQKFKSKAVVVVDLDKYAPALSDVERSYLQAALSNIEKEIRAQVRIPLTCPLKSLAGLASSAGILCR